MLARDPEERRVGAIRPRRLLRRRGLIRLPLNPRRLVRSLYRRAAMFIEPQSLDVQRRRERVPARRDGSAGLDEVIANATTFIADHAAWAGPIVGVMAFGESLALIGMLIPATTLMLAVGGMMGAGIIDPLPVAVAALIGAVLGDWLSFLLGRRIGKSAYRLWPLNRHRTAVARTRLFFRRHGVVSILFGRFLGPIRATVPLVAGVLGMPQRLFQIANVASAVLWVPALFAPGYFAVRALGPVEMISEAHIFGLGVAITIITLLGSAVVAKLMGGGRRQRGRRRTPARAG